MFRLVEVRSGGEKLMRGLLVLPELVALPKRDTPKIKTGMSALTFEHPNLGFSSS